VKVVMVSVVKADEALLTRGRKAEVETSLSLGRKVVAGCLPPPLMEGCAKVAVVALVMQ
jgi:hypothetical protein